MTNKERAMKRNGKNMAFVVQKKSTPLRNPRKRGGSPNGVSDPPIFATRKIKKTITCTLCFRSLFARIRGRINSIAAPVVPIQLAKTVPMKIIMTFFFIIFGWSVYLGSLLSFKVIGLGLFLVFVIYLVRLIVLFVFNGKDIITQLFLAPRGLITILLFFAIPKEFLEFTISSFEH